MDISFPSRNYADVDMEEFGGEGMIRLFEMDSKSSRELTDQLIIRGKAAGFSVQDIRSRPEEFDAMFNIPMAIIAVSLCGKVQDGNGGWRQLTEKEVEGFPTRFLSYLFEELQGLGEFPSAGGFADDFDE